MAAVVHATREDVKGALDVKETARNNRQIDRALEAASRTVEALTHRKFRPVLATRYFDWPNRQSRTPWRLWLNENEVISVTSLTVPTGVIASSDYFLEPDTGPPYTHVEIDLASSAAFESGDTPQRAIAITGLFGYSNDEESVGSLASGLAASLTATASITWTTPRIGVGDVLRINNERMIVTAKTMVDSTQNLGAPGMTAQANNVTVPVTAGSSFAVEEVIAIESERMLIVDIIGNNLTVKRAYDGTVLAAHSAGVDIYTYTGVELDRAQLGTTLAAHSSSDVVYRHVVPGLVREFVIAEAINTVLQEGAGYARTAGSGENEKEMSAKGLLSLRSDVKAAFGRKLRVRAI
jgi:hypothetical protein